VTQTLEQLVDRKDPAWPGLAKLFATARNRCEVLPPDPARADAALLALQVSTHATLGALAHECGGVLVADGWLRLLGGGHERLPRDLGTWNLPPENGGKPRLPGAMLVADDAVGGFYAVNGGRFPGEQGRVHYFSPATLGWEDLEVGYTELVSFCANGDLARFYDDLRFEGWEEALPTLRGDQAFFFQPPLFAEAAERKRKAVPVEELFGVHVVELPRQLAAMSPKH
jgi:hypothetical protein